MKAVSWLKEGDPTQGFVSVSHDLTAVLWHWEPGSSSAYPKVVLRGHERGIDSVGVNSGSTRLATGGWDTNLKIWHATLDVEHDEPPSKKLKGLQTKVPLHTLKGHKEAITSTIWTDSNIVCTGSMDHTIKFWDAEVFMGNL